MSRRKIEHGWVLQYPGNNSFVDENHFDGAKLQDAFVCRTREVARRRAGKGILSDRVRKVSLTVKGRAKKIIPGR